ncbi:MAG: hypothetical protein SFW62_04860 [Alphaproteobacteria bacterium]|nr:hypothetical protein [Alphaproteobacteria bacterium]
MRAVTLGGQAVNANQLFCMASAVRESLEETFGSNGHDTQLEADREMYELKDNIVNFFSRVKSTSR